MGNIETHEYHVDLRGRISGSRAWGMDFRGCIPVNEGLEFVGMDMAALGEEINPCIFWACVGIRRSDGSEFNFPLDIRRGTFSDHYFSRADLSERDADFLHEMGPTIWSLLCGDLKPTEIKQSEEHQLKLFTSLIQKFANKSFRGCDPVTPPWPYQLCMKIGTLGETRSIHFSASSDCRAIIATQLALAQIGYDMKILPNQIQIDLVSLSCGDKELNWGKILREHYFAHVFSFLSFLG